MRKTTTYGAMPVAVLMSAYGGPPQPTKPALIDLQKRALAAADATTNAHDAKKYSELFTPDATVTEYGLGEVKGREAIAAGVRSAFGGFPDFEIGVSKNFVKNELVVREWVITGTHKGEFAGAKPTNKTMGVRGADVLTFTPEGLIRQAHRYFDTSTVLAQLGIMKAPAPPVATLPSGARDWHVAKGTPEEGTLVEAAKALDAAFETKTHHVLFAAGDTVISELSFTATQAGQVGPLTPTKKPVTLHAVEIVTFKDGKVLSRWTYSNSFELR